MPLAELSSQSLNTRNERRQIMVVTSLIAAAAASKWILAAKIMTAVGSGMVTVGRVYDKAGKKKTHAGERSN